jgi:hypothetical protein
MKQSGMVRKRLLVELFQHPLFVDQFTPHGR